MRGRQYLGDLNVIRSKLLSEMGFYVVAMWIGFM